MEAGAEGGGAEYCMWPNGMMAGGGSKCWGV